MTLTFRSLLIGALLSVVVAMYSAFAGLKIGGVYWPIITVSIMSLAILTILGNTNKHEVNIAQTAASAGGLLAAGLIFTIPAIWLIGLQVSLFEIFVVSIVGGLAGIVFSIPLRKEMIEKENLPYPDGAAAAALIEAGDEGGKKAKTMFSMFGIGAIFSYLRDGLAIIPAVINLDILKLGIAKLFSFGSSISLIPFSGGYLIGPRFTGAWFLGAIFSYFLIIPYLLSSGLFSDKGTAAVSFTSPLGIGIVIGASIAYFLLKGIPAIKNMLSSYTEDGKKNYKFIGLMLIVFVGLFSIITELNVVISVIAILGAFIMAYVGARVTGEMNVDPMEIFAMIVLILAKIFFGFNALLLVLLAAVVCISAGIAGDFLQDLKTGNILKTNPRDQMIAQIVGVLAASVVLGLVLISLNQVYGIGGVELPAPQAKALSAIVSSDNLSGMLVTGAVAGFILATVLNFFTSAIIAIAFGIGLYVPIELSFPLFLGGLIRFVVDKKGFTEKGRLVAAGLIAGEGFIGVLLALIGFFLTFT